MSLNVRVVTFLTKRCMIKLILKLNLTLKVTKLKSGSKHLILIQKEDLSGVSETMTHSAAPSVMQKPYPILKLILHPTKRNQQFLNKTPLKIENCISKFRTNSL